MRDRDDVFGELQDFLEEFQRDRERDQVRYANQAQGRRAAGPLSRADFIRFCRSVVGALLLARTVRQAPVFRRWYVQPHQETFWVLGDPASGELRVVDQVAYGRHVGGALVVVGALTVTQGPGTASQTGRLSSPSPWTVFDFNPMETVQ